MRLTERDVDGFRRAARPAACDAAGWPLRAAEAPVVWASVEAWEAACRLSDRRSRASRRRVAARRESWAIAAAGVAMLIVAWALVVLLAAAFGG